MTKCIPYIPLRDMVLYPEMLMPLFIGREASLAAIDAAILSHDSKLILLTQHDASEENPEPEALYRYGVEVSIVQHSVLADGNVKLLVEVSHRVAIESFAVHDGLHLVHYRDAVDQPASVDEAKAISHLLLAQFSILEELHEKLSDEVVSSVRDLSDDPVRLYYAMSVHLDLPVKERQELLEFDSVLLRGERLYSILLSKVEQARVEKRVRNRVKRQMEHSQRDYFLNEQMRAIQKELGDQDGQAELAQMASKIASLGMPKAALEKAENELKRLKMMPSMSPEAGVIRSYLEVLCDLPWRKRSRLRRDIAAAERILDEDHYGLDKVKEHILEHLAVLQLSKKVPSSVMCLMGPPGVGKTSLARSIAKATHRVFIRISLGGVHDESDIRGHRRTYIGSMPGRIMQAMAKAGCKNPLILLDEIDKMGRDMRGDPSHALLEVLDPQQNKSFNDHYLEVDYDLSEVLFMTTANTAQISSPLLDRMDVLRLPGYTDEEKKVIAKRYLLPRQCKMSGLSAQQLSIDDGAITELLHYYTREAGVRNLERKLGALCRKSARRFLQQKNLAMPMTIAAKDIKGLLGPRSHHFGLLESKHQVGVVTGLAWTEVGGELLPIETLLLPGKGKLILTGQLGDVMQESAQAAFSYVRSRTAWLGLKDHFYQKVDVHMHIPEGAIPKDGPSAGLAMALSMASALTGIPVRRELCMTGEINLRGKALMIGGLKEKLLAAHRGGLTVALIPEENLKDLQDIPESVRKSIDIHAVKSMDEVFRLALLKPKIQHAEDSACYSPSSADILRNESAGGLAH